MSDELKKDVGDNLDTEEVLQDAEVDRNRCSYDYCRERSWNVALVRVLAGAYLGTDILHTFVGASAGEGA